MGQLISSTEGPLKKGVAMDGDVPSESSSCSLEIEAFNSDRRPLVLKAKGHYIYLQDGRKIIDACGGAAVACLGHGNTEVFRAMEQQAQKVSYVPWAFFDNESTRDLCDWLVNSTGDRMTKVYLTSSGSEAMDGAMKLAREFFVWKGEAQRVNFIAREESYHGTTVGALSLGGHVSRRAPFEPMLLGNIARVPACNPYRQRLDGESDVDFIARKASELDDAFLKLGPDTVCAFVAEPVVGAAAGCMPAVPGYLQAMKAVCDRYGALLILDEVMCGMGRTGTVHAWEQEGVVPDIQAVGKGLGGGYQACSAILAGRRVAEAMRGAAFTHGHTYQNHPVASAAALAVQRAVERDGLLANVQIQGARLGTLLQSRLADSSNVGDVRGRGLFWAVEFVRDRATREPFDEALQVARRVHDLAVSRRYQLLVYHGQGCAGGRRGDHVMIMPAYNVTGDLVEIIVEKLACVIQEVFDQLKEEGALEMAKTVQA